MNTPNREGFYRLRDWIRARHMAWYLRVVKKQPPPWTEDPIVGTTFFTNVYRELDPGTRWLVRHLLDAPEDATSLDMIFNVLVYRMALNENSKRVMGFVKIGDYIDNSAWIRKKLRSMDGSVFTPAYMVRSTAGSKIDSVCDSFLLTAQCLLDRGHELLLTESRKEWVGWAVERLHGVGPFVAFQSLVDLCYPEVGVLTWSNDDWVTPGPGASRGLSLLFTDGDKDADQKIKVLCDLMNPILEQEGLPGWGEDQPFVPISRSNMQNCLCELSKYDRALRGDGAKRRFREKEAWERDREQLGHGQQLDLV